MAELPEVLAGPIVRRVEPNLCSFWIALSHPASVQVSIWPGIQDAGPTPGTVESGQAELAGDVTVTLPVGRRLHVAVVTVKLAPPKTLQPGQVHSYDIQVVTQSERKGLRQLRLLANETLAMHPELPAERPLGLALGYVENRLPTFVTAPPTIEQVRMAHCSCRKTTSPGHDALAWLDRVIDPRTAPPDQRPQQLFMTGDQIYADDFSSALLVMLNDLAQDLMGAREQLVVTATPSGGPPIDGRFDANLHHFPAARRQKMVIELGGYTTEDGESHLLSFGEYAAMYLAVWSPRVWRALGKPEQIFTAGLDPDFPELQPFWSRPENQEAFGGDASKWLESARAPGSGFERQIAQTTAFRDSVPHVARALANVATYMIFDDHDVTDDWNLNKKWVNRVNSRQFGRHIVRNAIMAYGVFQGWGNDPVAFESGRNAELFAEIKRMNDGEPTPGNDVIPIGPFEEVDTLCGLSGADFKAQARWSYHVPAPKTQVVVLDTRTRRKFTGQAYQPPDLVGLDRDEQIPQGPLTDGREVLFVVSAAPVLGPDVIDALGWPLAQVLIDAVHLGRGLDATRTQKANVGVEKYDAEGWSTNDLAREDLLKRLAPYERTVFLSGDVHFACSVAMDYYRKAEPKPSRLVQLTSSPARNRFKPVVKLLLRQNAFLQTTAAGFSADRLAWTAGPAPITLPEERFVSRGRRARVRRSPALLPAGGWPSGTTLAVDKPPDWRWRLRLVRDVRPETALPAALRQPVLAASQELVAPTPADPDAALAAYRAVAARHQQMAADRFEFLRQMIFQTNIGLVALGKDAAGEIVLRHTLLSQSGPGSTSPADGTVHEIALEPSSEPPPALEFRDPPTPDDDGDNP